VLMIVTGGCVVAGWGFAWWRAIRLSRAELAVLAE
jgi:hypothetical protein